MVRDIIFVCFKSCLGPFAVLDPPLVFLYLGVKTKSKMKGFASDPPWGHPWGPKSIKNNLQQIVNHKENNNKSQKIIENQ